MSQERRTYQRITAQNLKAAIRKAGVLGQLKGSYPCEVVDLNRIGMALLTQEGLMPATPVVIEIQPPHGTKLILSGTIRYINPATYNTYRLGIEFDPFDARQKLNTPEALANLTALEMALMQID